MCVATVTRGRRHARDSLRLVPAEALEKVSAARKRALVQQHGQKKGVRAHALLQFGAASIFHQDVLAAPLACRGVAVDVGGVPRASEPPRAPPLARPVVADCSRGHENGLYECACNYMSKLVDPR